MSLYTELKRRNVLRVGIGYLAGSWLLIQILETLFPIYGLAETSIQVVVAILGIGFVPVLILTWVFEITPEGIKRDEDVDRDVAVAKTFDRVVVIVLVLALAFFAYDKFVLDPARDAEVIESVTERVRSETLYESYGDKSIVVLPFVNMSGDPDQDFFSDGISEELLNLLSRIRELRVISRTSAFSFKGKDVDIATVAEKLNVDHVLEGSVRKSGDKVRITVQLIDARTDSHLWSETYDRTLDDIFAIQDDIATVVVEQLKMTLLDEPPESRKIDPDAYVLYLQARYLITVGDNQGMSRIAELLGQVLELAPDYVPAMNALSLIYYWQARRLEPSLRGPLVKRAYELTDEALEIDPDDPVANAYRAWSYFQDGLDPAAAAPLMKRAVERDPSNEDLVRTVSDFARSIGRPDQAIALGEYAIARNPQCAFCYYALSQSYRDAGLFDEAEANAGIAQGLGMRLDYSIAKTQLLNGQAELALPIFEQMDDNSQKFHVMAMALYSLNRQSEYEVALARIRELTTDETLSEVAQVYAWTGDFDAAFDWLDRGIEGDTFSVIREYASPFFSNLHADPRWQNVLERIGRSPEQLAAIEFDLKLPQGGADSR